MFGAFLASCARKAALAFASLSFAFSAGGSLSASAQGCGPWNNWCMPQCGEWNNWCQNECGPWNNWCLAQCGAWNNCGKLHEIDILHVTTLSKMFDEAPKRCGDWLA